MEFFGQKLNLVNILLLLIVAPFALVALVYATLFILFTLAL